MRMDKTIYPIEIIPIDIFFIIFAIILVIVMIIDMKGE